MKIGLKFRPTHARSAGGSAASSTFCGVEIKCEIVADIESISCAERSSLTIVDTCVILDTQTRVAAMCFTEHSGNCLVGK